VLPGGGRLPASFYDWHRRGPSSRQRADDRLLAEIGRIHRDSGGAYGAPRIHAELQIACGVRVGRKRVARLMRTEGWSAAIADAATPGA
jgi:putative transposase